MRLTADRVAGHHERVLRPSHGVALSLTALAYRLCHHLGSLPDGLGAGRAWHPGRGLARPAHAVPGAAPRAAGGPRGAAGRGRRTSGSPSARGSTPPATASTCRRTRSATSSPGRPRTCGTSTSATGPGTPAWRSSSRSSRRRWWTGRCRGTRSPGCSRSPSASRGGPTPPEASSPGPGLVLAVARRWAGGVRHRGDAGARCWPRQGRPEWSPCWSPQLVR